MSDELASIIDSVSIILLAVAVIMLANRVKHLEYHVFAEED